MFISIYKDMHGNKCSGVSCYSKGIYHRMMDGCFYEKERVEATSHRVFYLAYLERQADVVCSILACDAASFFKWQNCLLKHMKFEAINYTETFNLIINSFQLLKYLEKSRNKIHDKNIYVYIYFYSIFCNVVLHKIAREQTYMEQHYIIFTCY